MTDIIESDFPNLTYLLSCYLSLQGEDNLGDYLVSNDAQRINKVLNEIQELIESDYSDEAIVQYFEATGLNDTLVAYNILDWHGWVGRKNLEYLKAEIERLKD